MAAAALAAFCLGATAQGEATGPVAAASGSAVTASAIPYKREPAGMGDTVSRTGGALLLVMALAAVAAWVLRRRGGGFALALPARRLQVLESRRIGPKGTLVVVRWNAEELLIAHGEGGTTLLARSPAADDGSSRLGAAGLTPETP